METNKKKLYIFDLDGTLYDSGSAEQQFYEIGITYIGSILSLPRNKVLEKIKYLKEKHKTVSTTIALVKEFRLNSDDIVVNVHLKINLDGISLNSNIIEYINDTNADKIIFTASPEKYAKKVLFSLEVEKYFNLTIGMESLKFQDKKNIESFKFVEKVFPNNHYTKKYFWDDLEENREIGSLLGWIPMIP